MKIITKIIANQLKPLMSKLTNPNQCSFMSGRQGVDNIVLTQELLHSMRKKKGKVGWKTLKLDLEKAYDCISWPFLEAIILKIGF